MTLFNFEEVYILYHYVPLLLACWGCGYVMFFFKLLFLERQSFNVTKI